MYASLSQEKERGEERKRERKKEKERKRERKKERERERASEIPRPVECLKERDRVKERGGEGFKWKEKVLLNKHHLKSFLA